MVDARVGNASGAGHAWALVACLGIGHAIVDAASIFSITSASGLILANDYTAYPAAWWLTQAYNLVAFAPQALLGWSLDRTRLWLGATVLGGVLVTAGCLADPASGALVVALSGVGNALFHVGAGGLVLPLARGRAAMPGVLVGPGDMGVFAGVTLARGGHPAGMLLAGACLLAVAAAMWLTRQRREVPSAKCQVPSGESGIRDQESGIPIPASRRASVSASLGQNEGDSPHFQTRTWKWGQSPANRQFVVLTLILLCLPVSVRSLTGSALVAPFNDVPNMFLAIHLAAALTKVLAGFVADSLGWIVTTVPAAAAAAIVVALVGSTPAGAIVATVLVQTTMPVTLAAMSRLLPTRPALAFGLAASALSLGTIRSLAQAGELGPVTVCVLQLACAFSLLAALVLLRQHRRN